MGVIAKNDRQITLYYNSQTTLGKQTFAYVEPSRKKILAVDISRTKVTGTQWAEIAEGLNVEISNLINQEHPDFVKLYGSEPLDMERHDWLKLLQNHPEVLACPVVIDGNRFIQINNPSDFAKFLDTDNG